MMNSNIKTTPFFLQDTIVKPNSNLDTLIIKKRLYSSLIIKTNYKTYKPLSNKADINTNLPKDSIKSSPLFLNIKIIDKSLINSYNDNLWFYSNKDSSCYIINKQHVSVFKRIAILEKKETTTHFEKAFTVREKHPANSDWNIIPILMGMFLLASVITIYRKYLGQLFESIVYRFASNKLLNDKNIHFQRLSIMLDVLFIMSFSLIVDQITKRFQLYTPPEKFEYIIFLISCSFLLALRFFRWIVFKLSALFSNHQSFFSELYTSSSLYTRILGVFLLPFVFLITYSTGFITTILLYISVFSIFIMLILRTISMFKVFIVRGFSIFYFILYLCALEIVPLLVILKEVKSR